MLGGSSASLAHGCNGTSDGRRRCTPEQAWSRSLPSHGKRSAWSASRRFSESLSESSSCDTRMMSGSSCGSVMELDDSSSVTVVFDFLGRVNVELPLCDSGGDPSNTTVAEIKCRAMEVLKAQGKAWAPMMDADGAAGLTDGDVGVVLGGTLLSDDDIVEPSWYTVQKRCGERRAEIALRAIDMRACRGRLPCLSETDRSAGMTLSVGSAREEVHASASGTRSSVLVRVSAMRLEHESGCSVAWLDDILLPPHACVSGWVVFGDGDVDVSDAARCSRLLVTLAGAVPQCSAIDDACVQLVRLQTEATGAQFVSLDRATGSLQFIVPAASQVPR